MNKKILGLTAVLMSGSVFAQQGTIAGEPIAQPGSRHMVEFNADSILAASLAWDKSKQKGSGAENDARAKLNLNYAFGIHSHLQVGARFNYGSGFSGNRESENVDFAIGLIANHTPDFQKSAYASLYLGYGFAQNFGTGGTRDEINSATLAIGKRFPLDRFGIKHVTYSPEIAFKTINSPTNDTLDYSQSLEFRLLQFSVFF